MYGKLHETETGTVLACCDRELLGQVLKEGELAFEVKESFYGGKRLSEKTFFKHALECESGNLVGERCIGAAQRAGLISASAVRYIGGVPHAQFFRI